MVIYWNKWFRVGGKLRSEGVLRVWEREVFRDGILCKGSSLWFIISVAAVLFLTDLTFDLVVHCLWRVVFSFTSKTLWIWLQDSQFISSLRQDADTVHRRLMAVAGHPKSSFATVSSVFVPKKVCSRHSCSGLFISFRSIHRVTRSSDGRVGFGHTRTIWTTTSRVSSLHFNSPEVGEVEVGSYLIFPC